MMLTKEVSFYRLLYEAAPVSIIAFSVPFYLGGWVLLAAYEGKFIDFAYVFSLIFSTYFSMRRMKSSLLKRHARLKVGGYFIGIISFYITFIPIFIWVNIMAMVGLEVFFYTDRWYVSAFCLVVTGLFGSIMAGQILYALTEIGVSSKGE